MILKGNSNKMDIWVSLSSRGILKSEESKAQNWLGFCYNTYYFVSILLPASS